LQLPTEDRYLTSKTEIKNRLSVLLGGRVAEEIVFSEVTTGAHDDLSKATEMATKMVCELGMSEKVGPLTFRKKQEEVFLGRDLNNERSYSNHTAELIDSEIKQLILDALANVRRLLTDNRAKLDRLAEKLIEKEVLDSEEVDSLIHGNPSPIAAS